MLCTSELWWMQQVVLLGPQVVPPPPSHTHTHTHPVTGKNCKINVTSGHFKTNSLILTFPFWSALPTGVTGPPPPFFFFFLFFHCILFSVFVVVVFPPLNHVLYLVIFIFFPFCVCEQIQQSRSGVSHFISTQKCSTVWYPIPVKEGEGFLCKNVQRDVCAIPNVWSGPDVFDCWWSAFVWHWRMEGIFKPNSIWDGVAEMLWSCSPTNWKWSQLDFKERNGTVFYA